MNFEVSQVVGEGSEEDEEVKTEKSPEEDLEIALGNYRELDIAQLHLNAHNLIQKQKTKMQTSDILIPNFAKISEYLSKVKDLAKRKQTVEKKCQAIKIRLQKIKAKAESLKE